MIPAATDGPRSMEAVWKNPLNLAALDQPGQRVRLRLESTAVRVEHIGEASKSDFVSVTYTKGGELFNVKAKTVVMAGGGLITQHVGRDLDETRRKSYYAFNYSASITANLP